MRRLVTLMGVGLVVTATSALVLRADGPANTTLASSTYYGGGGWDEANDVAVGPDGSVYVAGWSDPLGTGPDAFVVKLTSDGSQVLYSTVVAGSGFDIAMALAIDAAGNVYVVGHTTSTDFPVVGGFQTQMNGDSDAWIAKLDAGGSIVYSTYYGGNSFENGMAIALGPTGAVYVGGSTGSSDLPGANGFQQSNGGGFGDGFALKLDIGGNTPVFATYLGGSGEEVVSGLAVDAFDRAYVVGGTDSSDFPVALALQPTHGGVKDGFVSTLSPEGTALVFSSYFGGSDSDHILSAAVDSGGGIYLTGSTWSFDFPTRLGYQRSLAGAADAFLTKLAPGGAAVVYSTYFGGNGSDVASHVVVDVEGNAHITGETDSASLPLVGAIQPSVNGYDGFYARFSRDGSALVRSTPIGGSGFDASSGLALGLDADVWLAGRTDSVDFPLVNPVQALLAGPVDAFIARVSSHDAPPSNQNPVAVGGQDQVVYTSGCAVAVVLDGSNSSDSDGDALHFAWSGPGVTTEGAVTTVNLLPGKHTFTLTVDDGRGGTATDTVEITVIDNVAPPIESVTASPNVLGPPNHQMVPVDVSVSLASTCEVGANCRIVHISSNEPVNGQGDGDTASDWVITGALSAELRAERGKDPAGRIYTITVECVDEAGNVSQKTVAVHVPK